MTGLDATRRVELGGLPAYVADVPGQLRAGLVFRVGQADEALPRRGLIHLLEHVVLGEFARADDVGGVVDVVMTCVMLEGAEAEVAGRLRDIARRFAEPPVERIETERRILAAEDGGKAPHPVSELLALWFGARGPGVTAYREFGLHHVGPSDITESAAHWFTRGNAALVLTRPIPGLTDLPLPEGPRRAPAAHSVVQRSRLPGEVAGGSLRMALGAPLEASDAVTVLAALLERKAWAALRQERGLAYDVECRAKPIDARHRLLHLTSDVADDDAGAAARIVVQQIADLARGELSDDDLDAAKADLARRGSRDPMNLLLGGALAELLGRGVRMPPEILASIAAVTRDDIAATAASLRDSLLVTLPLGAESGVLPPLDLSAEPLDGTVYRREGAAEDHDVRDVIVAEDGLSSVTLNGEASTVMFDQCVAAVREPDDALLLIGEDGDAVIVDRAAGSEALARVESALPSSVFVPAEGETPDQDEAARAHRRAVHEREQDDRVVPKLDHGTSGSGSTSQPVRVIWNRRGD